MEFQESFQHWFSRPSLVLRSVLDVAVAVAVPEVVHPVQRGARVGFERAHQVHVAGPAFVLIQQHEEERRGVTGTVVGRLRPFVEMGQLAETQLVKDASRFFFRQFHFLLSLGLGQRAERGTRQFRLERAASDNS